MFHLRRSKIVLYRVYIYDLFNRTDTGDNINPGFNNRKPVANNRNNI